MGRFFSWKGCLIGCGSLVLLFIIFSVSTGYWLMKKGDFDAETSMLDDQTDIFFQAHLRLEDPLLVDYAVATLKKTNQNNPEFEQMPGFFKKFQSGQSRRDIEKMLPIKFEIINDSKTTDFAGALGYSSYTGVIKLGWYFFKRAAEKDQNSELRHHGDFDYIVFDSENETDEKLYISNHDNKFYFGNTPNYFEQILDRAKLAAPLNVADPRLRDLNLSAPAFGFFEGASAVEKFKVILQENDYGLQDLAWVDDVDRVGFELNLLDTETMILRLFLDTPRKTRDMLSELEASFANLGSDQMEMKPAVSTTERGFQVDIRIKGIGETLVE